jgi:hypothetical protein
MSSKSEFSATIYDFFREVSEESRRPIRRLLRTTDERKLLRFFRWERDKDNSDREFDRDAWHLVDMLDEVEPRDLAKFLAFFRTASDAEILAFVQEQRPAPPSPAVSAEHTDKRLVIGDELAFAGIASRSSAGERPVLSVLVGRDWANSDDETPRESALLPPPPPIDAMPAYSMRFPVRRADEPQLVRSAYSLDRSIKALRDGDVRTKEADLLPWPELNDSGEYYTSDEIVEFSLMAYHPDRRARLIAMSPETADKFGVVFGFGRPAQPWLAARLENGIIVKGILNLDTWARFADALPRVPEAGALPSQGLEPPRRKRRMPDRFIRPIEPIGDGWAF